MAKEDIFCEYFPMPAVEGKPKEELELRLAYTKGGPNYFTGGQTKRGVWLYCTPVERTPGSTKRMLMDDRGRKHLVRSLQKKTARVERELCERLMPHLPEIAAKAIAQDWPGVAKTVDYWLTN